MLFKIGALVAGAPFSGWGSASSLGLGRLVVWDHALGEGVAVWAGVLGELVESRVSGVISGSNRNGGVSSRARKRWRVVRLVAPTLHPVFPLHQVEEVELYLHGEVDVKGEEKQRLVFTSALLCSDLCNRRVKGKRKKKKNFDWQPGPTCHLTEVVEWATLLGFCDL